MKLMFRLLFVCIFLLKFHFSYADLQSCSTYSIENIDYLSRENAGFLLFKQYLLSLVPAFFVGGASGVASACFDKHIGCFPLSWLIFPALRNLLMEEFSRDCAMMMVPHSKSVSSAVARIVDWIIYFYILYPPFY